MSLCRYVSFLPGKVREPIVRYYGPSDYLDAERSPSDISALMLVDLTR